MEHEADQYRLCCGSLLDAEWMDGKVVIRCIRCGQYWERLDDGSLARIESGLFTNPLDPGKHDP